MAGTHANEGCKLGAKDIQVPSVYLSVVLGSTDCYKTADIINYTFLLNLSFRVKQDKSKLCICIYCYKRQLRARKVL